MQKNGSINFSCLQAAMSSVISANTAVNSQIQHLPDTMDSKKLFECVDSILEDGSITKLLDVCNLLCESILEIKNYHLLFIHDHPVRSCPDKREFFLARIRHNKGRKNKQIIKCRSLLDLCSVDLRKLKRKKAGNVIGLMGSLCSTISACNMLVSALDMCNYCPHKSTAVNVERINTRNLSDIECSSKNVCGLVDYVEIRRISCFDKLDDDLALLERQVESLFKTIK